MTTAVQLILPNLALATDNNGHVFDLVREKQISSALKSKKVAVKARPTSLAYVPNSRETFTECEYDLGEIGRARSTESLIDRSIRKHVTLCLKEGYNIVGKNPKTVAYIKKRLFEFSLATTIPFKITLREALENTVGFANTFLAFRRDPLLSSGKPIKKFGKPLDPIAGIFHADPSSMRIRRNRWGEVKEYEQVIEGDYYNLAQSKKFLPEDILHIAHNRQTGFAWGMPFCLPALDDVRLLRNVEELVQLGIHKLSFPILHWKVGNEKRPAISFEDGTSEITQVEEEIQGRDAEGMFVTTERHEIEAIQVKWQDTSKYLEYFRDRVMTGLNLSSVDMGLGETANRGTATSMIKSLQHTCKDFQDTVAVAFTSLFDDLLAEGGFDITEDDRVYLSFPEIDIETQQIVQNHQMALYQGHAITEDEMRVAIGKEPITDEQRKQMFFELVELPRIEAQGEAKASAQENLAANKNKPTNQSGKKPAAGSRKNDEEEKELNKAIIQFRLRKTFEAAADLLEQSIPSGVSDKVKAFTLADLGSYSDGIEEFISNRCSFLDAISPDTVRETLSYVHDGILSDLGYR